MAGAHHLGRAVPAGDDVLGQIRRVPFREATSQTKVTDFEVAIRIEQQIGGFEVTMQHVGRVNVLHATQSLVDEVLDVVVSERVLGINNLVQIRVHEIHDHVNIYTSYKSMRA